MNFDQLPSHVCHLHGTKPGPRVVVFGGTHGDEKTGVLVVQNILKTLGLPHEIPNGSFESSLIKGDLFFGIGNPEAVAANSRSVSGVRDLNRCFHESFFSDPKAMQLPDQQRAFELKDLLASADYFFDLHSVSVKKTVPFVGLTTFSTGHEEVCRHIPVRHIIDVNSILGHDVKLSGVELEQTPTTCSWVNRHGGIGLCYEMGYQKDITSVSKALTVLVNLLEQVGAVDFSFRKILGLVGRKDMIDSSSEQRVYRLVYCERNQFKNFVYDNPRYAQSFVPVKAGELIGGYEDGQEVRVKSDGLLAFPASVDSLDSNQSLFYLAIPVS